MRRNKKTTTIYQKKEEVRDVFKFVLDKMLDAPHAPPVFTFRVFEAYVEWRKHLGLTPTLFTMHGFSKVLPYEREVTYDPETKLCFKAIPHKKLA